MAEQHDKTEEQEWEEKFAELIAEKGGLIPPGFAQKIEDDFTTGDMGIARRLALAYLEREFSETLATMKSDRAFAVASASMLRSIGDCCENYKLLQDWMRAAQARLMFAICERQDSDEIFAEADRERAAHLQ